MTEHAQCGLDSRISQRLKVKVHKIKYIIQQVASKLFYSSLHAGYSHFFCRRHVFLFIVPFRNTRVLKSHQGYVWVQTVQII